TRSAWRTRHHGSLNRRSASRASGRPVVNQLPWLMIMVSVASPPVKPAMKPLPGSARHAESLAWPWLSGFRGWPLRSAHCPAARRRITVADRFQRLLLACHGHAHLAVRVGDQLARDVDGDGAERAGEGERRGVGRGDGGAWV